MKKEIWKLINDFPNYMVSNFGRIKSLDTTGTWKEEKILLPHNNGNGYLYVGLWKKGKCKRFGVHRLVAEAFIPNPQNLPCVNHKNELKDDNRVENLEWCDHKYNSNYGTCIERRIKNVIENGIMKGVNNSMYGKHHSEETKKKIGKANKNGKLSKTILQYDLDGNIIKEWPSTREIERELGFYHTSISACCKGKQITAYKYKWGFS